MFIFKFIIKNLTLIWWFNLILLVLNFLILKVAFLDVAFFIIWFLLTGWCLAKILKKVLIWSDCWILSFSYFTLFYLLSFVIAIFVDFYKLTDVFIVISLLIVGLIIFLVSRRTSFITQEININFLSNNDGRSETFKVPKYLILILPFLFILGLYLLLSARTGEYILTPWQVIPKIYVYVFLLITFTVSLIIFSKAKVKTILFLIILHSFLLHAYLPTVYATGFGGDKWRHLASEQYLMQESVYSPSLFGEPVKMVKVGPIDLPEVLVAGNKTSYGNQWGLTIILSKFLHIDIFWIDYLFLFLVWSIFFPLLLYKFGELIYNRTSFKLLLAFLPVLFYTFQVFGAITLPVALGSLFFFFVFYLWLKYLQTDDRGLRNLAIILSILMYFGYILNFILIIEVGFFVLVWRGVKNITSRRLILIWLIVLFILSVPLLEVLMGYGGLKNDREVGQVMVNGLADAVGTLTGLVAFIPRPTHIDQGNWFYNQTRQTQSEASLFSLPILPFITTLFLWGLALLAIEKIKKLPDKRIPRFILVGTAVLLANYIISWYFMTGNHILARRLDLTIAFFVMILIALGIYYLLEDVLKKIDVRRKVFALSLFVAVVASSTYTSGPFLEVVTRDEIDAAKYVWERIDKSSGKYCVIANTWPLLGLEYVSAREIIAGGFPVHLEYAQPERVKIFEGLIRRPYREDWIGQAFAINQAGECWYMLERKWVSDKIWQENIELLGLPQEQIGKVYVWQIK